MSRATEALDRAFGAVNEVTKDLPAAENTAVQLVLAGTIIQRFAEERIDENPEVVRLAGELEQWVARAQLEEIEKRCEAATKGPWETHGERRARNGSAFGVVAAGGFVATQVVGGGTNDDGEANSTFIAHAREDVPALVARVRELEKQLASGFSEAQTRELMAKVEAQTNRFHDTGALCRSFDALIRDLRAALVEP